MIKLELVFPLDFQGGNMPFREDLVMEFDYSRPLPSLRGGDSGWNEHK
jgi:hypothetical protein